MISAVSTFVPNLLLPSPVAGGGAGSTTTSTSSSSSGGGSRSQSASSSDGTGSSSSSDLTATQQREVAWLESRDLTVRAHEAAHQSVGGDLVSGVSFVFETGPDGRSYAVGGDVTLDVSIVPGNPQATAIKMAQVRAAALAPAQPSAQDEMVAAEAGELQLAAEQQSAQPAQEPTADVAQRQRQMVAAYASASASAPAAPSDGSHALFA